MRQFGIALMCAAGTLPAFQALADGATHNHRPHVLIADQSNNRVIEVDPATHQVVWQFGTGSDEPGPNSVVGVNDAEGVGRFTLISGTAIPTGSPPLPGCSNPVNGCPDNQVMLVSHRARIACQ
ncbi:hypothetical protein Q4S45_08435 [Massilia sp. R2A-15]|uniref:hypothetical protein n=1 Tax=Massilia sp. R2A-15 TaxID=3064278 RepID=UPI00273339AD|nr:hypothetical protein [Massilia sp. R2A-15]WLI91133.1 hypothetical protein Q4S45_08435 [Massilia sp. R2A-15]